MPGLSAAATNAMLDNVFNNAGGDVRIRLHTGQPGASGTANTTSAVTTQQPAPFAAADTTTTNTADVVWAGSEVTGTVTVTHWSAWLAGSATPGTGSFVASGPLGGSYALTAGTAFRIKSGTFVASMNVASDTEWPNPANTGVPAGWTPTSTRVYATSGDYSATTEGELIEDVRFDGASVLVYANNVTIRRCEFIGGIVYTWPTSTVSSGLLVEDCTFIKGPYTTYDEDLPCISPAGYTARRCYINFRPEGLRSSAGGEPGAMPVVIEDCWVRIIPPDVYDDWHGDGLQGYGGVPTTVTNCYFELNGPGTAPVFWPDQSNDPMVMDRVIVSGGGWPFRIGAPGCTVTNLKVVEDSWGINPVSFDDGLTCDDIVWEDNWTCTLDANYQPTDVDPLPC